MIGTLYRYPHPYDSTRFIYVGQGPKRDKAHRLGKDGFGRRFKKMFPDAELPRPIKELVEVSDQQELNDLEAIRMFQYHTWRGYPDGMNLTFPGLVDYKTLAQLGGLIGGCKNAESGQSSKLGKTYGRKNAEKEGYLKSIATFETCLKGHKNQSREARVRGGEISGKRSAENGQLELARNSPQAKKARQLVGRNNVESGLTAKMGKIWGPIAGRIAVESGHLKRIRSLPQSKKAYSENGIRSSCLMWNVRRGKPCTCGKHIKVTEI